MTDLEHQQRCTALAQYVELVTRLRIFHRGAMPTAQEAAHDLAELETLLATSGIHFKDPELSIVALRAQLAGALHVPVASFH